MKEIVLDTETTGLSVKEGHRIVEIGCIELENLIPTKKIFHCYINPERKVSKSALEVHGHTDEFLANKQKFEEIADDFLKFIEGKKIVIHNASKLFPDPGNLFLAISRVSITFSFCIFFLLINDNSLLRCAISNSAL